MTRINCSIPPKILSDKHLLAEHREIVRIPNTIASGKAKIENIPEKFSLGKGHVKFFYNKLLYLHKRYLWIYKECKRRGFKVQNYSSAFNKVEHLSLFKDYYPKPIDSAIVIERLLNKEPENKDYLRFATYVTKMQDKK